MQESIEHQIYIGCNDSQSHDEIITQEELRDMVTAFFRRRQIDFSMVNVKGGYRHEDGYFVTEDSLCINIIGRADLDIIKLTKSLGAIMNQENALVVRNPLVTEFR